MPLRTRRPFFSRALAMEVTVCLSGMELPKLTTGEMLSEGL